MKIKKHLKKKGDVSVGMGIKVITAVVCGALVLMGLYTVVKDVVLPKTNNKVTSAFNYASSLGNNEQSGGQTPGQAVEPVIPTSSVTNLVTSYEDNKRFSSNGELKDADGLFIVSNYIERHNQNDVFRIKINGASASDLTAMLSNSQLYIFEYYSADGMNFTTKQYQQSIAGSTAWTVETGVNGDPILVGYSETTKKSVPWVYGADTATTQGWNYFRIGLVGSGADVVITVNEEI